jgi:electron transport complex protein RnfB
MGFPETASGIEIKILEYLFSADDAALFLELSPRLETGQSIAHRLGRPAPEIARQLEDMADRGLLFRMKKTEAVKYAAVPFVHGLFEFQIKNLQPELAHMVEAYSQEGFEKTIQKGVDYFLRTVPVRQSLDITQQIASYDDAIEILKSKENIVVTDCICRKRKELIDQSCGKPLEACFMFGSMGQYYLDRGMGRKIDFEEALSIMTKCQEAGLVTQPATSQNPSGMCNCCGDCCGVLEALNKHPRPAEIVFTNHYAVVDSDTCSGCETCLDRCQMTAIRMNEDGLAEVNLDRCIGCGLCVTTCPEDALKLVLKPADRRRTPPATNVEQMMAMAKKRGLI